MTLLTSTKTHGSVVNAIMDMVERLLTWDDSIADDEALPTTPLQVNDLLPVANYLIQGMFVWNQIVQFANLHYY
jgi:hypothetical protein